MLLKDIKVGQKVSIALEDLKKPRNGYLATKDIIATVVSGVHCSIVSLAWEPTQEDEDQGIVSYQVLPVNEYNYPKLTRSIGLVDDTPCSLIEEKKKPQPLPDTLPGQSHLYQMQVGDQVKIPIKDKLFNRWAAGTVSDNDFIIATVINPNILNGALIVWGDQPHLGLTAEDIQPGMARPLSEYAYLGCNISDFPETLTKAYYLNYSIPCELIMRKQSAQAEDKTSSIKTTIELVKTKEITVKTKPNSALFLFTCIGAGAGASHYLKQKMQNEIARVNHVS